VLAYREGAGTMPGMIFLKILLDQASYLTHRYLLGREHVLRVAVCCVQVHCRALDEALQVQ
jgi:hypothetical protein